MESSAQPQPQSQPPRAGFATTHWSMVLAAGHRSSPAADAALESLCQTYWYPLYAYTRRRGYAADDAADLTQEFFAELLGKSWLQTADQKRGRFRSFLLTVFQRFLGKEQQRQRAQKRGGHRRLLSIHVDVGEQRYQLEPADPWTPETLYQRRWALTLLESVLEQLRQEYAAKDKQQLFDTTKPLLSGEFDAPAYQELAAELKMSANALRVAVHRLRERYRQLLHDEVARTVDGPEAVEDELSALQAALRGGAGTPEEIS